MQNHILSIKRLATTMALATTLAAGAAHALPGQLDLGYGEDGVFTRGNGGANEQISALLPAPRGQVIVAGALYRLRDDQGGTAGNDMTVLRLRADGSLDDSFGTNGITRVNAGLGDSQEAFDLVRQPDGKLLVAGMLEKESYTDAGIARLLPDGTLDTTFGGPAAGGGRTGFSTINLGVTAFSHEEARGIALQSTGKAVLAARAPAPELGTYSRFTLTRIDANGDVDTTFGTNGKVVSPAIDAQSYEYVTAIARLANDTLPADDRILVVGYAANKSRALMRRYLPHGAPDTTFGTGGTVIIDDVNVGGGVRTGIASIEDAVILRNGKILVVGTAGDRGFTFLRYHANGTPDTTFGSNGRVLVKISDGSQNDAPYALTVQRNGTIIAAGYGTTLTAGPPRKDFMIVRLLPNGQRDASFGNNGVVTYPMSDNEDNAYAVRVLGNGRIVVAGDASVGNTGTAGNDMAVLGLQGDPDIFADSFQD